MCKIMSCVFCDFLYTKHERPMWEITNQLQGKTDWCRQEMNPGLLTAGPVY